MLSKHLYIRKKTETRDCSGILLDELIKLLSQPYLPHKNNI